MTNSKNPYKPAKTRTCSICKGSGVKLDIENKRSSMAYKPVKINKCPICNGVGRVVLN